MQNKKKQVHLRNITERTKKSYDQILNDVLNEEKKNQLKINVHRCVVRVYIEHKLSTLSNQENEMKCARDIIKKKKNLEWRRRRRQ